MNDQEVNFEPRGSAQEFAIDQSKLSSLGIEMALCRHPSVCEVVVVPAFLDRRTQALTAFVTSREGVTPSEQLVAELAKRVQEELGSDEIAATILLTPTLPKTRSGKIMRDILEEIAVNDSGPSEWARDKF